MKNYFCLGLVAVLLSGCQSVPRWDWWRASNSTLSSSSAIAHSADGLELPSVSSSQDGANQALADAGGGNAPVFKPATTLAANTETPAAPIVALASNSNTVNSTAGVVPQNGLYDSSQFGSAKTVANTTPNATATGPVQLSPNSVSPYYGNSVAPTVAGIGGSPTVGATIPKTPTVTAPGLTAINTPSPSVAPINATANFPSTGHAGYAIPNPEQNPLRNSIVSNASNTASVPRIAAQPYRPGGTSDYSSSPASYNAYNIATRPNVPTNTAPSTTTIPPSVTIPPRVNTPSY